MLLDTVLVCGLGDEAGFLVVTFPFALTYLRTNSVQTFGGCDTVKLTADGYFNFIAGLRKPEEALLSYVFGSLFFA
jgi:hypothetical protein